MDIVGMETALKDLAVEELNGTIVRIEMLNTDMTRVVVWSKTAHKRISVRLQNLDLGDEPRRILAQLMEDRARWVQLHQRAETETRPATLANVPAAGENRFAAAIAVTEKTGQMLEACTPLDPEEARKPDAFLKFFAMISEKIDAIVREVEEKPPVDEELLIHEKLMGKKFPEVVINFVGAPGMNLCHAALMAVAANLPFTGLVGHVEKRPSTVHGTGLFTTVHVNAGEMITLYRCDILVRRDALGHSGGNQVLTKLLLTMPPIVSHRTYGPNGENFFGKGSDAAKERLRKRTNVLNCRIGEIPFRLTSDVDMPDVADAHGHLINAAEKDATSATRDMNCYWMPILGGCVIVAVATQDITEARSF